MTETRPLGFHERHNVAKTYIDASPVITPVALLELKAGAGQEQADVALDALQTHLEQRIQYVLAQFPLLAYRIRDARSRYPKLTPIVPRPTTKQIFSVKPKVSTEQSRDVEGMFAQIMREDRQAFLESVDLQQGPLWRVSLRQVERSDDQQPLKCIVVLTIDHSINDGRGALNLFSLLLQTEEPILDQAAAHHIPPASDKVFNFKPSFRFFLGVAFEELILPLLPLPKSWKARLLGSKPWPISPLPGAFASSPSPESDAPAGKPANEVASKPSNCTQACEVMLFSAPHLITNLKKLAQSHIDPSSPTKKAATLHSVIHTLSLAALYAALSYPRASTHPADLDDLDILLHTSSPLSIRADAPDCAPRERSLFSLPPNVETAATPLALTTGNFVGSFMHDFHIRAQGTFWSMTSSFASTIADPRERVKARWMLGLTKHIPDFEAKEGSDKPYRNGWEKFFYDRRESEHPYDTSLTISNLGMVDLSKMGVKCASAETGWEVRKTSWAQAFVPLGEAFGMDVVGFSDGSGEQSLSLVLSTRPDAFKDKGLYDRFRKYLRTLVHTFSQDLKEQSTAARKLSQDSSSRTLMLDLHADPTFASIARFLHHSETPTGQSV